MYIFIVMAEGVGFEPTVPCDTPVFKTGALNHYATPPFLDYIINKGYMIELMIWLMK